MSDLTFLAPGRLLLLALPLLLAIAYVIQQIRRRAYVLRFSDLSLFDDVAPDRPGWRRHLPAIVAVGALIAMLLGYARPAVAEAVASRNAQIMLAIDTSKSMEAEDVTPNRVVAAKAAADAFLSEVPEGVRVGLVTFDSGARVVVPPVDDVASVRRALGSLNLSEGTAIGDAIFAALGAFQRADADAAADPSLSSDPEDEPDRVIVLLSDGETTVGRSNESAASAASQAGVPVHTVAFGTDSGTLELPSGERIPVPVNRPALAQVARTTKGTAFSAETAETLTSIYEDLGKRLTTEKTEREVADMFAGGAFVLAALAAVGSLRWFGRIP